ncbi:helix-turn-helix transcriptional regulator [Paenibacillus hamazuiensis]|uniref:helix-turn-helix transcriptional regulator n=1 Tax=Paenibacillus hamazuiensis TaxID=2936508 RepID=UPI00200D4830|nr:AraC family transcriptional regulator [Paenibacillus hamazuiensis]
MQVFDASLYQQDAMRDSQLRVLSIGRLDFADPGGPDGQEGDADFRLLVVQKGRGEILIGGIYYPLLAGYYYLLSGHRPHGFLFSTDSQVMDAALKIIDEPFRRLMSLFPAMGPCQPKEMAELQRCFDLQTTEGGRVLTKFCLDAAVKSVLVSIAQRIAPEQHSSHGQLSKDKNEPPFPIAEYIRERFSEKLTLEGIGRHFGFHPHYVIKLFNDRMGMSPIQYLQEVRLLKAMEYLQTTDMTVAEISDRVGWTMSYFSRLFHQRKGLSPSQYRKRHMQTQTVS